MNLFLYPLMFQLVEKGTLEDEFIESHGCCAENSRSFSK